MQIVIDENGRRQGDRFREYLQDNEINLHPDR